MAVSTRKVIGDYRELLRDWQRIYEVAGMRDRNALLRDWQAALQALSYLEVLKVNTTMSSDPMVEVSGRYSITRRNTDLVMIDVERLWQERVAKEGKCLHAFIDTQEGFNFLYCGAQSERILVSGIIRVTCTRPDP
jgi:hypothetical protein